MTRRAIIFCVLLVICIGIAVLIAKSSIPASFGKLVKVYVVPTADKDIQAEWDETKRRAEQSRKKD